MLQKHPVCALVMRAFGNMLAEVPLIATRLDARRKGHARYLMTALESLLAQVTHLTHRTQDLNPHPSHHQKDAYHGLPIGLWDMRHRVKGLLGEGVGDIVQYERLLSSSMPAEPRGCASLLHIHPSPQSPFCALYSY